jgi:hypothetical protein
VGWGQLSLWGGYERRVELDGDHSDDVLPRR